jgi:hypothetical protein
MIIVIRASASGRETTKTRFGKGIGYGDFKQQRPWSDQDSSIFEIKWSRLYVVGCTIRNE